MNPKYTLIKTGHKKVDELVFKYFNILWENNVSLKMINKEFVKFGGENCSGIFNADGPELICAVKKPIEKWIYVFIHEFCHFEQYMDNCEEWKNLSIDLPDGNKENADLLLEKIIKGETFSKSLKTKIVRACQDLERDCEERTYKKIKINKLEYIIDPKVYVKKANAYILFYNIILKHGKWYEKPPYEVDEIINLMPDHFLDDYTKMTKKLYNLYEKNFLK